MHEVHMSHDSESRKSLLGPNWTCIGELLLRGYLRTSLPELYDKIANLLDKVISTLPT